MTPDKDNGIGRRDFLKFTGAFAVSAGALSSSLFFDKDADFFRPPAAATDGAFLERCILCQKCVDVCPTGVIKTTLFTQGGYKNFKTPSIEFRTRQPLKEEEPAEEETLDKWTEEGNLSSNWKDAVLQEGLPLYGCVRCGRCVEVCPTDALENVPIEELSIGSAEVITEDCIAYASPGTCLQCFDICPVEGAILNEDEEIPANRDEIESPIFDQDVCIGCGQCYGTCPVEADPDPAIRMINDRLG